MCGLKLCERSERRATCTCMAPDTHRLFSATTLCAYTASTYIHHYFYATIPDNETHVPYDCIHVLHTEQQLYCQQSIVLLGVKKFVKIKCKYRWACKKYRKKEGMKTQEEYPVAEKLW